uniref:Uncharacterized protein n=1 Tax=Arundo donax TaxID=35708 RepID=A0A0A8Z5B3_ARUDO
MNSHHSFIFWQAKQLKNVLLQINKKINSKMSYEHILQSDKVGNTEKLLEKTFEYAFSMLPSSL